MQTTIALLTISATMTTLVTEAIKKMIGEREYSANILVAIVSVVVSGLISVGWIILYDISLTAQVGVHIVALIILSWLCAMIGYDKVKQTITQLRL